MATFAVSIQEVVGEVVVGPSQRHNHGTIIILEYQVIAVQVVLACVIKYVY